MTKRNYTQDDRQKYDQRFTFLLNDLQDIGDFPRRDKYLYPLMDKVIFHDFETAVEATIIDFETPITKQSD